MKTILENQIYSEAEYLKAFTSTIVNAEENGIFSLEWKENNERREEYCRKYFGIAFIFTDYISWSMKEIIEDYTDQEYTKNDIFHVTKDADHFSLPPQFHWTDQMIRVHFFTCLGALVPWCFGACRAFKQTLKR